MNNAAGSEEAKAGNKVALMPKLRFPEFLEAVAWQSTPMGEAYSFQRTNSLSRDKLNYLHGTVKNIHYGDIHTKFSSHFNVAKELVPYINESESGAIREGDRCLEGDVVFADASEDLHDIGKCVEIVNLNQEKVVSGLHTILARRILDRIAIGFGGHLFRSNWVRSQIQREAQGSKVLSISATRLQNILLPLPIDQDEQRKVTECLSSVDELIAAQARKVEALKNHKIALMQRLFPRETEPQPRLRFQEFQNANHWRNCELGKVSIIVRGGSPRPIDGFLTDAADGLNWLKIGDIDKEARWVNSTGEKVRPEALSKTRVVNPGDLILSNSMSFGRPYILNISACIHDGWIAVTKIVDDLDRDFLYYSMLCPVSQKYFIEQSAGSGVQNLNIGIVSDLIIGVPDIIEQKAVADCLSSLDDAIAAQTQVLECLKTHKKGLMQQLFPAMEEASTP
jgi:type I restriction enzyme S subunit